MKVGFFCYFPLGMWTQTGDMRFLENLKNNLEKYQIQVELFDIWSKKHDYDLIHMFGYTHELAPFAKIAKQYGYKLVWSPIITSLTPAWKARLWGILDKYIPVSTTYSNLKYLLEVTDVILPGSETELFYLNDSFGTKKDKNKILHYGIDKNIANVSADVFAQKYGIKNFVLMVGRISSHKGQIKVIQALENTGIDLVFSGYPAPYEPEYCDNFFEECKKRSWVHYLKILPDDDLFAAYKAAKVHVLPSIYECPGFANLEAGMAGTNVVAVKNPDVYEYLGDEAYYCNPNSIESIREEILAAYHSDHSKNLQSRLINEFSWEVIAMKALNIYQDLLKEPEN